MPLQAEAVAIGTDGSLRVLADGDPIALTVPGQGGYVLYAGAQARNLEACGATLAAELIDPQSGNALSGRDQRQANFLLQAGDWFLPPQADLRFELPNIPACPDALGVGVQGRTAILRVTVTDKDGKTATVQRNVVPTCPESSAQRCQCICGPNYHGGC